MAASLSTGAGIGVVAVDVGAGGRERSNEGDNRMSVHDAEPGDIYADENGKLWRIISICREPTVEAEEVEGALNDPNAPPPMMLQLPGPMSSLQNVQAPRASIVKRRVGGGVGGLMWRGWRRILRNDATTRDWSAVEADGPVPPRGGL